MNVIPLLALIVPSALAVTFPPGYWDQGYGMGANHAVSINISINVVDLQKSETAARQRLLKAGATASGASESYGGIAASGGQRVAKSLSFSTEVKSADKAARTLLDLGDLQSYSRQKNITPSAIRDIRERIDALSAELSENAEPLKRMPIASLFLNSKLAGFKQAEERYKRAENKAVINLTLIETAGPEE